MALSWNEIRTRAIRFSKEWENETSEDAEAKSFLDDFFDVFGITRRRVGTFEKKIKKIDGKDGFIDMLWKGQILIEMKSAGKNLDKAYKQATDYFPGLTDDELPAYTLVCDFKNFRLYNVEEETHTDFMLKDLHKNVKHFGFLIGMQQKKFAEQDPVNIEAAEKMGKLHDQLKAIGYTGHPLELYLVRLVFCLFADDTGIFEKQIFQDYIKNKTKIDGSDLASCISELFYILNTKEDKRLKNIDEDLAQFPFVNGKLFEEQLPPASFDSAMRTALLDSCALDWSKISPAIFGSLFQSVMNPTERRNLGAHYTSEKNILKVIKPLFLDELWQRFESVKNDRKKLVKFHDEIALLRFLDPACGCGNFLIVAYRELRLLELKIIEKLFEGEQQVFKHDLDIFVKINVDRFYGIEYEEFPAQIAQVAMWLMDHQMNTLVSLAFGENYIRLPLRKSATIAHGNALRTDWQALLNSENVLNVYAEHANIILAKEEDEKYKTVNVHVKTFEVGRGESRKGKLTDSMVHFNYILGNPPFVGYAWQSKEQKEDMLHVFNGVEGAGVLDYVTCWYIKAGQYLKQFNTHELIENGKGVKCAFVSTNSISQGEQVGILWNELFNNYHLKIHFAHRTFNWSNEAKGNAAVHVVIIGFSNFDVNEKYLYEYDHIKGEPHEVKVKTINPYLVEAKDVFIKKLSKPLCPVPSINRGNDATDDGNLLLNLEEKEALIKKYPEVKKWIKPFLMGKEFINNIPRFCLWLKDIQPSELKKYSLIYERIERVKKFREQSKRPQTLKMAKFPYLFGEKRQPLSNYLAIPKVSSENRTYIPIAFCNKDIICGDKLFNLPNATLWHFGIITSLIHMTWMKYTCGRMKSDFSYSNTIVYNNFPWPENPTEKQKQTVEEKAQQVLNVRKQFPDSSLADLYDPLTMPPALVKAHNELDKAVDQCYRSQPFLNETKRIEFLFELYDRYTAGLFAGEKKKLNKKHKSNG